MFSIQELSQLAVDSLKNELKKARREQFKYKMGVDTHHLKDNHMLKIYRTYISRLLTLFKEKTISPKKGKKASQKNK